MLVDEPAEPAEEVLDPALRVGRDGEDHLEEGEHRHEEDDRPPHGVEQDRVDPAGAGVDDGRAVAGGVEDRRDPRRHLARLRRRRDDRHVPRARVGEQVAQRSEVAAAAGDDGDDRDPEGAAEGGESSAPWRRVSSSWKVRTTQTGRSVARTCASRPRLRRSVVASRVTTSVGRGRVTVLEVEDVGDDPLVGLIGSRL